MTTAVNVSMCPDSDWVIRAAGQTGIPERALRAYVAAAATVNATAPTCGIGWNTVAVVGFVETARGTYGGGSLTAEGQVGHRIVDPVLDRLLPPFIPIHPRGAGSQGEGSSIDRTSRQSARLERHILGTPNAWCGVRPVSLQTGERRA